jgi:urate oxidase
LKETSDRILGTSFSATWNFATDPGDYRVTNNAILTAMLEVFAENYSSSAQATLYEMGEAALSVCAEISVIELAMPNKHCLLIDLSPFGLENKNEVFVPTDEPHGQIEATLAR